MEVVDNCYWLEDNPHNKFADECYFVNRLMRLEKQYPVTLISSQGEGVINNLGLQQKVRILYLYLKRGH